MIQSPHPAFPGAARFFLDLDVAHTGEPSVVDFCGGLFRDVCAGGRVCFTRLLHASANEALQVLLPWHRQFSFGYTTALSPAARRGDAKNRRNQSGSLPPFASRGTPAGAESKEVWRGSPPPARWRIPGVSSSRLTRLP